MTVPGFAVPGFAVPGFAVPGFAYRDSLLHGTDVRGVERASDAVSGARATLHPHLRGVVNDSIGPDKAIKSMEEFEALRFMRAENLTTEQTQAFVAIRNAIPNPTTGTDMQKVVKGSRIDQMVGQSTYALGYVAKQADAGTGVLSTSDELIEGLRQDYPWGLRRRVLCGCY